MDARPCHGADRACRTVANATSQQSLGINVRFGIKHVVGVTNICRWMDFSCGVKIPHGTENESSRHASLKLLASVKNYDISRTPSGCMRQYYASKYHKTHSKETIAKTIYRLGNHDRGNLLLDKNQCFKGSHFSKY